jgi:hypothetical protein
MHRAIKPLHNANEITTRIAITITARSVSVGFNVLFYDCIGVSSGYNSTCQLMNYLKGILSGLTAIIIAEIVPGPWSPFRLLDNQRATGLAAVMGELLESFLSPLFWVLVIALFAIFFAASRLKNEPLRVVFFWIPTLTASCLIFAMISIVAYVVIHFRNS